MSQELDELWALPPTVSNAEPLLPATPPFPSLNVRKRPFLPSRGSSKYEAQLADALNTSSDPALFSSDETPDAENYSNGAKRRKKKTYKGTWWDNELNKSRTDVVDGDESGPSAKRKFRRNFDSGVFMADESSGTDLSSDGVLEQELLDNLSKKDEEQQEQSVPQSVPGSAKKLKVNRTFEVAAQAVVDRLPPECPSNSMDHSVRKVVKDCLDSNNEMVDWTGMGLDYLPPAVTDLKSMIKRIKSNAIDANLAPFEAKLKIFLGNNNFTQLPPPLLEITNIELLSIRQNSLNDIPPGIRVLKQLKSLNVSANNIQYLPYEVIEMLRFGVLTELNESPNPWMAPPELTDRILDISPMAIITGWLQKHWRIGLRRQIVSKPVEFYPDGSFRQCKDGAVATLRPTYLSEMVLRALMKHNTTKIDLSTLLSEDHPQSVHRLLKTLYQAQTGGGRVCTFCHSEMILPRYQWYEWWHVAPDVKFEFNINHSVPSCVFQREDGVPQTEIFINESDLERTKHDLNLCKEDELIPFQRMACGCIDVSAGLKAEADRLQQNGRALAFNATRWIPW